MTPRRYPRTAPPGVAIEEADLIVCVFDGVHGPTDADRQAVNLLRRSNRAVIYVANKADTERSVLDSNELYSLGVEEIHPVSALHGRGFAGFEEALVRNLPPLVAEPEAEDEDLVRVAVVGRPNAMEEAEIVVLMCDAAIGVAEQDAKILGLADERGRGIVVVLNKMDQLSREELKEAENKAREKLAFAAWAPYVSTSALTGRGTDSLLKKIIKVRENFYRRVPTGELNRFFETVLQTHPPPTQGGKAPRLFYVTQAETAPPLFAVMANAPEAVHFSYQRYVKNQLRKHFDFEGVPVRIAYRARRRREAKGSS